MSRPRAATSVATSTTTLPCLKSSSVLSRSCWVLSPWIADAFRPSFSNCLASRLAPILVLENTITCDSAWSRTSLATAARLCSGDCTRNTACVMFSASALRRATSISCGDCRKLSASLRISPEKVAENMRFWRSLFSRLMIR